jgi:hypothetical protein
VNGGGQGLSNSTDNAALHNPFTVLGQDGKRRSAAEVLRVPGVTMHKLLQVCNLEAAEAEAEEAAVGEAVGETGEVEDGWGGLEHRQHRATPPPEDVKETVWAQLDIECKYADHLERQMREIEKVGHIDERDREGGTHRRERSRRWDTSVGIHPLEIH